MNQVLLGLLLSIAGSLVGGLAIALLVANFDLALTTVERLDFDSDRARERAAAEDAADAAAAAEERITAAERRAATAEDAAEAAERRAATAEDAAEAAEQHAATAEDAAEAAEQRATTAEDAAEAAEQRLTAVVATNNSIYNRGFNAGKAEGKAEIERSICPVRAKGESETISEVVVTCPLVDANRQ